MSYPLGQPVRISASFAVDGTPTDPGAVTFRIKRGHVDVLVLDAGTTPPVVKDATGEYHADVPTTVEATYFWRAEGTAPAEGVLEGNFLVSSAYE